MEEDSKIFFSHTQNSIYGHAKMISFNMAVRRTIYPALSVSRSKTIGVAMSRSVSMVVSILRRINFTGDI